MLKPAPRGANLAGIIPLSGWKSTFDFPWPDYLQPLREGFLAVERSVHECALAGCDSIWIVCNDDVAPLVKERVGDYVMSPRYFEEKDFVKRKDYHEKWIPVFYTPIDQKDRHRRDSLGWSILHGALTVFKISNNMSKWVCPTKYYISFPYGIYNPSCLSKNRASIRGPKSVFLCHEGKTIKDNKYLGFTLFPGQWLKLKRHIKESCTGGDRSIPPQERWSSRNFTLDKIFNNDIMLVDKKIQNTEYYEMKTWQSLQNYYSSDMKIPRPTKKFMKPYTFNRKEESEYKIP